MGESGRALRDAPPFAKCAKDGAPGVVVDWFEFGVVMSLELRGFELRES